MNRKKFLERKKALEKYLIEFEPNFFKINSDLFNPKPEYEFLVDFQSPSQVVKLFVSRELAVKARSKSTGKIEWAVGKEVLEPTLSNKIYKSLSE